MAVLAGIDEAGYGPHLGPLVVAAASVDFAAPQPPDPDLWHALGDHIRKGRAGADQRVVICDSKLAYTSGGGLATLERTVLGVLAAQGLRPQSLAELTAMTHVAAATAGAVAPLHRPWDRPESLALPAAATATDIDAAAAHLAAGLRMIGARGASIRINVASAARLNRLMTGGRNKADALFSLNADLVAEVLDRWRRDAVLITLDRHGGRRYYAPLLAGAFPMTTVETIEESAGLSRYRLVRSAVSGTGEETAAVEIAVRDKCESWSLPTALASMAAKYVRELHMIQLNAYFRSLVPDLRATAGYGLDAWRFLADVARARAAAGVPDEAILRAR